MCKINPNKILVRKPEGKRPLRYPRHRWEDNRLDPGCRWEDNIKMDLREIEWEGVDWMHLAWHRDQWWDLVNAIMGW
jgi:hypothetical protein